MKHGDGSTAWNTDDETRSAATQGGLLWWAIPALAVMLAFTLDVKRVEVPVIGSGWARLDPNFIPSDMTREVTE